METGGAHHPRLYTRTGDRGTTALAGGVRVAKDSERIRAYGTLDELGAHLGRAESGLPPTLPEFHDLLLRLEHELFVAQSEVATAPGTRPPDHRIERRHVERLESDIDRYSATFEPLRSFVLPRGEPAATELHVARTVARRAERELWTLHRTEPVRSELLEWMNRLSDLLFALALSLNRQLGWREVAPDYTV